MPKALLRGLGRVKGRRRRPTDKPRPLGRGFFRFAHRASPPCWMVR
jgi:hypothetical protein